MRIWIVNPYAILPSEPWREDRAQVLSRYLIQDNHSVVVWTNNIIHRSKQTRSEDVKFYKFQDNLRYNVITSYRYKRHISLQRVLSEITFGFGFLIRAFKEEKPTLIIVTEPSIFYFHGVLLFRIIRKCKLIIDILDIWPEAFEPLVKSRKIPFLKIGLFCLYRCRRRIFQKADGIVSVTKEYTRLAKSIAPSKLLETVYLGFNDYKKDTKIQTVRGIKKNKKFWIIYSGTLGANYDFKSILDCAFLLQRTTFSFEILIIGDGEQKKWIISDIEKRGIQCVSMLNSMPIKELNEYYKKADLALNPYKKGSRISFPLKTFDYINFEIPIINSLKGEISTFIKDNNIGVNYESENVQSLFLEIKSLLENEINLVALKENIKKIRSSLTYQSQYIKYKTFIDEIINVKQYR